jgi:hypothetical protein
MGRVEMGRIDVEYGSVVTQKERAVLRSVRPEERAALLVKVDACSDGER